MYQHVLLLANSSKKLVLSIAFLSLSFVFLLGQTKKSVEYRSGDVRRSDSERLFNIYTYQVKDGEKLDFKSLPIGLRDFGLKGSRGFEAHANFHLSQWAPDGCSGPMLPGDKDNWKPACYIHDLMYSTLPPLGKDSEWKIYADKALKINMSAICQEIWEEGTSGLAGCIDGAKNSHNWVINVAESSFKNGQNKALNNQRPRLTDAEYQSLITYMDANDVPNGDASDWEPGAGIANELSAPASEPWIRDFGRNTGGWLVNRNPRLIGDINNDGYEDIVGFSNTKVKVALNSKNGAFADPINASSDFIQTWNSNYHPRMLGDVNGDNMMDLVGFSASGVYVALSNGSHFVNSKLWIRDFSTSQGWKTTTKYPRLLGDVDGDGDDDIVGLNDQGVVVAKSNGTSFDAKKVWNTEIRINHPDVLKNWNIVSHKLALGDVNGDGTDDLIVFWKDGVKVGLSIKGSDRFEPLKYWIRNQLCWSASYRSHLHPRLVADVNNDDRVDIVGFGPRGVQVSLANANQNVFDFPYFWVFDTATTNNFRDGWSTKTHIRLLADVWGNDGRADIVGFGNAGVFVGTSTN